MLSALGVLGLVLGGLAMPFALGDEEDDRDEEVKRQGSESDPPKSGGPDGDRPDRDGSNGAGVDGPSLLAVALGEDEVPATPEGLDPMPAGDDAAGPEGAGKTAGTAVPPGPEIADDEAFLQDDASGDEAGDDVSTDPWDSAEKTGDGAATRNEGGESGRGLRAGWDDADDLAGAEGDDTLEGGAGPDRLFGGFGNDMLLGGEGDDHLADGAGENTLRGGAGQDTLSGVAADGPPGAPQADTLDGGDGQDRLILGAADQATGGKGADTFLFGPGLGGEGDGGAPEILDFDIAQDELVLVWNDYAAETAPELGLSHSTEEAGSVEILGDGVPLARVTGAGADALTAADITLLPASKLSA